MNFSKKPRDLKKLRLGGARRRASCAARAPSDIIIIGGRAERAQSCFAEPCLILKFYFNRQ